jgi:hypothetical protein
MTELAFTVAQAILHTKRRVCTSSVSFQSLLIQFVLIISAKQVTAAKTTCKPCAPSKVAVAAQCE